MHCDSGSRRANPRLMSDASTAIATLPRSEIRPDRITPRMRKAVDGMVEQGLSWQDAAKAAGLDVRSMRKALERPHVIAFIRKRKEMLRQSVSAANIHRLRRIADAAPNMPAVAAIKFLEEMGEDRNGAPGDGIASSPGVTINIINGIAPASGQHTGGFPVTAPSLTIEAAPLAPPSGRNRP